MKKQKADIQALLDGHEVVFKPTTAKGRKWLREERGIDPKTTEYAAYWKGIDKWSRERDDEYDTDRIEMAWCGLAVDDSKLPEELRWTKSKSKT